METAKQLSLLYGGVCMRLVLATAVIVLLSIGSASAQTVATGSVKADIFPGIENMHKYQFNAIPLASLGEISERVDITTLWDTPTTYVVLWVINVTDPNDLDVVVKVFGGHDRYAKAETYLAEGTYEIWLQAIIAPTHFHMNTHFSGTRSVTRSNLVNITGESVGAAREASNLRLEAEMSSDVERMRSILGQ